jgi:hypothetical protein
MIFFLFLGDLVVCIFIRTFFEVRKFVLNFFEMFLEISAKKISIRYRVNISQHKSTVLI